MTPTIDYGIDLPYFYSLIRWRGLCRFTYRYAKANRYPCNFSLISYRWWRLAGWVLVFPKQKVNNPLYCEAMNWEQLKCPFPKERCYRLKRESAGYWKTRSIGSCCQVPMSVWRTYGAHKTSIVYFERYLLKQHPELYEWTRRLQSLCAANGQRCWEWSSRGL